MYLGTVAEGQCGNLLRVAEPVLLGSRMQVFYHYQAATCVGKEACREGTNLPGICLPYHC